MKKITLLLFMLISCLGFSQTSVAELGVDANVVRIAGAGSGFMLAPCGYTQPTAGFPNAGNISDPSTFTGADDINVPVFMNFAPENLVIPLLTTTGSSITGVEITFYADAAGLPGAVAATAAMAPPASQAVTGTAFGRDIVEAVVDLTGSGISLSGGGLPGGTNYWMGIRATNSLANTDLFWELTFTITNGESAFSLDDAGTWQVSSAVFGGAPIDFVFSLTGDCALPPPVSECGNAPELIPAGAALPAPSSGDMDPSIANVGDTGLVGTDYTFDNVTLNIEHTWASDLTITLTSPLLTSINLSVQNGGSTGLDTAADLVFTDASGNAVTGWGGGAPAADYQAEGGLLNTIFAGEDINGPWTININDAFNGDIGQLNSYCLDFTPILGSPPVIMCPANIPVNTDAGVCGATVNYTDAVAIDPDGDLVSVIQISPDPGVLGTGDVFPVGTTTVTFRATDSTGNTADCSFDIIVTDDELPVITCNDFTVSLDSNGMATVTTGDVASATDNCPTTTLAFGGLTPASLTTNFTSNNGFSGNMFDIMATNDIVVNSFDVNNSGGTVDYEVYMKMGSYVGSETNAGDWTLVGSVAGVAGAGADNPTSLGLNMNISVGAGDMVSFYVACTNNTTHNYINGVTEGALWASDANLEVYEGIGKGGPAVFSGGTFRPRNFSGTIVYDFGTPPSTSLDFTCADVGDNTVMVTATDESGNTATCSAVITVVDDIAPIVVCIGEQLTGPNTVSDSPGIAIVDNTTFSTTINIPDSFTINDVNMNIDIEHTWTGDITLTLEHPDGTQVIVFDDADGCSGDNMFDTYDDESANPLDCQAGTGDAFPLADYIPSNALAAFDGKDSAGVWTLFVEDDAGGDTGILNSWGITYDFDPIVATPLEVDLDANGNATINATDLLLSVDEACGWTATVGGPPTPTTLETTFVGGNGNFGNMFDMNALTDVTVQSFDINGDTGATFDVEVYAKAGTYVGSETDPGAWTLIGTAPGVVSNGDGVATPLGLALGYAMAAGETHAFYVTPTDFSTGGFNYTNGNAVGDVFASDANIEFLEGAGSGYPFNGTLFSPRVFNGNIIYDAGSGMSTTIDFDCSNLGENIIEVTVTDDSGNVGTCFATVNVNDVTNPILICSVDPVIIELDENGEATLDPEALLGFTDSTFNVISLSSDNQSGAVGNTDFTAPVTDATDVTFDWQYDTADGAAFDSFGYLLNGVFTEVIDPAGANMQNGTTGPIALVPGDVFGFRSSSLDGLFGGSTAIVSNFIPGFTGQFEPANWTLTLDNSDGDAFFVEIPGGPLSFDACGIETLGLDIFEVTCDDIANSPITVTVFASDSSGNLASCTVEIDVVDLLAPIVTCPDDVTVDPGVGNLFWEVEDYFALGTASATDNCTDPLTIFSQDPAPGTLLPDGVYTITMSAEDEYGNVGTCTFELTIESILGVDDNGLSEGIAIFPNPTDSAVTISNATGIQLEKVAIYDVNGRLINTIDLSDMQQEKTIDVSQLATGVYMLQIQSENESTVKRLVKE